MSNTKMVEEGSDAGEAGEATFQIGDSILAFTYRLIEGIIISRAISEEGRLELTLIVAPHKKRGQAWYRTAILTRDAARLSKKMPLNFNFPIKNVENLRTEAKRDRGDPAWAYATCITLDKDFTRETLGSGVSDSEGREEEIGNNAAKSSSSSKICGEVRVSEKRYDDLETRIGEVEQLNETLQKKDGKKEKGADSSDSDYEAWKKFRKENKRRRKKKAIKKKKRAASLDSSKSSSSSDSDNSKETGEVGEKGKSGMFSCPFHESDARGFRDVKRQIKGQAVIRKHVRVALHNLYAEHYTLTSFADALVARANASAFKPFSTDINTILLGSLNGPWTLWNEQCLDNMMIGFLELVVRVSLYKEYPVCLEDGVRKWMRKKRIGTNTKYGPVSYVMQHAKFTDSGLVLFQSGWQKTREKNFGKSTAMPNTAKGSSAASNSGDKKLPSLSNQA